MKLQKPILFILFMLGFYAVYAGNHPVPQQFINHADWNFVENKGQISSSEIHYYGHQGGVYLYCQPGKISFVFTKVEKETNDQISESLGRRESPFTKGAGGFDCSKHQIPESSKISTSRADLVLLNSNPSAQIIASDKQEYYENYYTANTPEGGITNVHTYKTITYKSIYPNIDLVLHAKPKGMKYEFVVYPGGNVNDIQMQWDGLESIKKLKDSKIEYSCSLGKMVESKPVSFQGANLVKSSFIKSDNRIGFNVGRYDKTETLVIDPYLVWGTYFGDSLNIGFTSSGSEGSGISKDADGNIFVTGITNCNTGIATSGAYQTSYRSIVPVSSTAFMAKFSSAGHILWATYYGYITYCSGIACDVSGNAFLTGTSQSDTGIITTSGAYRTSYIGDSTAGDAFLAKFNGNGILQWATYYGGAGKDQTTGIATDINANVYIIGTTTSTFGIATSSSYQSLYGGNGDAFLTKFNSNGALQWATYFGGSGYDVANGVTTDAMSNIYITGNTASASGIATKDAWQTYFGGGFNDIFLAKFNNNGAIQWATYYGGNGGDFASGVATDAIGNVYFTGCTESDSGISTSGVYQTSMNGTEAAFLAKFSSDGIRKWGTYYGGNNPTGIAKGGNDMSGMAIATYGIDNIYITGYTYNPTWIATGGAYQTSIYTNSWGSYNHDAFIANFNSNGAIQWATYYGKNNVYGYGVVANLTTGTSIVSDGHGSAYITGFTGSDSGISTKDAYQTWVDGDNQDAFIAKFELKADNDAGILTIQNPIDTICAGTQVIKLQLQNYGLLVLNSASIGWEINEKPQPSYQWNGKLAPDSSIVVPVSSFNFTTGKYIIKTWTSKPNGVIDSIPYNDTSYVTLIVNPLPNADAGQSSYSICNGTHIKIGTNAQPSYTYSWTSVPAGFSSTLPNPVVSPGSNTEYDLTVTDTLTGCTNKNSANVTVSLLQAPVINVGKNQSICSGDSVQIGSSGINGDSYAWTSNPKGYSTTTANPVIKPLLTISYLLTVTSAQGCTNFDSVIIKVNPKPVVITGHILVLCAGLVIPLGGPPNPDYAYSWTSTPPGFFSNLSDPKDSPMITTEYHLKVTIPATGCTDSGNITFGVLPQPAAPVIDVKNMGGFEYVFKLKNADTAANYIWSFGDSSITHNEPYYDSIMLHTYSRNGIYKLTVEAAENHCVAYTHDVIDVNQAFAINIFPNPFDLQTEIQYTLINPAHIKISLTDEIGRQIGTLLDEQLNTGEYDLKYDGAAWKTRPGMYFVVFQMDDQVIVKKIIQLDSIYY